MASNFCSHCGDPLPDKAKFCPACGKATDGNITFPGIEIPAGANLSIFLCYLFGIFSGVAFLNLEPYRQDRDLRFHAWQSILFCITWVSLVILGGASFWFFPLSFFMGLINLGFFVLWVVLLVKSYNGETFRLPVLADFADKQAAKE